MPQSPPKQKEAPPKKEQVPDPTFSKFVDAPDPPLPFWISKIIIGILSLAGAGWAIWKAHEIGTLRLIFSGIFENVPGVPFLIVAFALVIAGVCAALSKFSRGAAGISAIGYFLAAGTAFTAKDTYLDAPLLALAIVSVVLALVLLISAAGGVHINLDD